MKCETKLQESFRTLLATVGFQEFSDVIQAILESDEHIMAKSGDEFHSSEIIEQVLTNIEELDVNRQLALRAGDNEKASACEDSRNAGMLIYATLLAVWRYVVENKTASLPTSVN